MNDEADRILLESVHRAPVMAAASTAAGGEVRILAEGDSWCQMYSDISTYPRTLVDRLDFLYRCHVNNIGFPGDTLRNIVFDEPDKAYVQLLKSASYKFFILSAGGVDFFSNIHEYVRPFKAGYSSVADCVIEDKLDYFFNETAKTIRKVAKQAKDFSGGKTRLVMHGYGFARPKKGGEFLGKRFENLKYDTTKTLPKEIIAHGIGRFNDMLADLDPTHLIYVDCRGVKPNQWHDEIHPTTGGATDAAGWFAKKLKIDKL